MKDTQEPDAVENFINTTSKTITYGAVTIITLSGIGAIFKGVFN